MGKKSKSKTNKKCKGKQGGGNSNQPLRLPPPAEQRIPPGARARPIQPRPKLSKQEILELNSHIQEALLDAVLARGANFTRSSLRNYFVNLIADPILQPISVAVLNGLGLGAPYIHERIELFPGHQEEGFPLLYWVCQWKILRIQGYWPAESELVDMVLKAGAKDQINQIVLANQTNALFFACKYADIKAVDLLLEVGIKVDHREDAGRTCLKNALEHPQPAIIQRLLEHLPVSDNLPMFNQDGSVYYVSCADFVVSLLSQSNTLISWVNLGPPSPEALNDALIQLRKKGCRFTDTLGLEMLGVLFRDDIMIPTEWNAPESFKELARTLVGDSLPESLRPAKDNSEPKDSKQQTSEDCDPCPICFENTEKKVTLYCYHTFCLACIINYAQDTKGKTCPVCRAPLCLDLIYSSGNTAHISGTQVMGLSRSAELHGIEHLTDDQVIAETQFQGNFFPAATMERLRSLLEEGVMREPYKTTYKINNKTEQCVLSVDLSAAENIAGKGKVLLRPEQGRVAIEISVKGVPLLAYVANRNLYTLVAKSVADQLRLIRIEDLQSKKFVSTFNAKKCKNSNFTCLEPFTLRVGDIEVTLRNAVVVDPDPYPLFGIQLGCDFLLSGIWCPIDVETHVSGTGEPILMRVDEDLSWPVQQKTKEMFRYYSHDGRSVQLPLLHFSPFNSNVFHGVSLRDTVKFDICYWCCRVFPEGMVACGTCSSAGRTVTYCDVRCQKAARKIHKRTIESIAPAEV